MLVMGALVSPPCRLRGRVGTPLHSLHTVLLGKLSSTIGTTETRLQFLVGSQCYFLKRDHQSTFRLLMWMPPFYCTYWRHLSPGRQLTVLLSTFRPTLLYSCTQHGKLTIAELTHADRRMAITWIANAEHLRQNVSYPCHVSYTYKVLPRPVQRGTAPWYCAMLYFCCNSIFPFFFLLLILAFDIGSI